jgi:hypothetical protein
VLYQGYWRNLFPGDSKRPENSLQTSFTEFGAGRRPKTRRSLVQRLLYPKAADVDTGLGTDLSLVQRFFLKGDINSVPEFSLK